MSEVMRGAARSVLADHSAGGFLIRRVASPGAAVAKSGVKPLARRALTPSSNKENVPPVGAVSGTPKRRTPLPDWYPRTPLRDITSIIKALERRRSRLQDAAAQQQIQWTEDPTTPVQGEQSVPQNTPQALEILAVAASSPGSTQVVANPTTSLAEDKVKASSSPPDCSLQTAPLKPNDPALVAQSTPQALEVLAVAASSPGSTQVVANPTTSLAEDKMKASSSPPDCSLQTAPLKPNDPALVDLEKELSSSIEQIEKIVFQNLKKAPKAAQPSKMIVQRRTLMSMR